MLKLCFVEVNFYVGVQFMLGSIFKSLDVNTNNGLANDTYNQVHVAELHRLAWNLGEAPLLFIVTPDLLLI